MKRRKTYFELNPDIKKNLDENEEEVIKQMNPKQREIYDLIEEIEKERLSKLELLIPECVECKYYPTCPEMELDGVFVGEDKKCEEEMSMNEDN